MKKGLCLLFGLVVTALVVMVVVPSIAQSPAPDPITPMSICNQMEQAQEVFSIGSKEKEVGLDYPKIILALKSSRGIPLAVRMLAPKCLEGSDRQVSLADEQQVQEALLFYTKQAIRAGIDVTNLLTSEELEELAARTK